MLRINHVLAIIASSRTIIITYVSICIDYVHSVRVIGNYFTLQDFFSRGPWVRDQTYPAPDRKRTVCTLSGQFIL
jgi:hypothetical protein